MALLTLTASGFKVADVHRDRVVAQNVVYIYIYIYNISEKIGSRERLRPEHLEKIA